MIYFIFGCKNRKNKKKKDENKTYGNSRFLNIK
jgi:hypothetical protein